MSLGAGVSSMLGWVESLFTSARASIDPGAEPFLSQETEVGRHRIEVDPCAVQETKNRNKHIELGPSDFRAFRDFVQGGLGGTVAEAEEAKDAKEPHPFQATECEHRHADHGVTVGRGPREMMQSKAPGRNAGEHTSAPPAEVRKPMTRGQAFHLGAVESAGSRSAVAHEQMKQGKAFHLGAVESAGSRSAVAPEQMKQGKAFHLGAVECAGSRSAGAHERMKQGKVKQRLVAAGAAWGPPDEQVMTDRSGAEASPRPGAVAGRQPPRGADGPGAAVPVGQRAEAHVAYGEAANPRWRPRRRRRAVAAWCATPDDDISKVTTDIPIGGALARGAAWRPSHAGQQCWACTGPASPPFAEGSPHPLSASGTTVFVLWRPAPVMAVGCWPQPPCEPTVPWPTMDAWPAAAQVPAPAEVPFPPADGPPALTSEPPLYADGAGWGEEADAVRNPTPEGQLAAVNREETSVWPGAAGPRRSWADMFDSDED